MERRLLVGFLIVGLAVLFAPWTVASADDNSDKTDFAFFDGTNPLSEDPPFGGAECSVRGAATLHASVTAHSSGPGGFVRLTYAVDGDWVQFPIASGGVLQLTQAIGGSPYSRRVRLSNGGDAAGARLVGSLSVIGHPKVHCQSCLGTDGAGGAGCQNNPGP